MVIVFTVLVNLIPPPRIQMNLSIRKKVFDASLKRYTDDPFFCMSFSLGECYPRKNYLVEISPKDYFSPTGGGRLSSKIGTVYIRAKQNILIRINVLNLKLQKV
jgi:hypothetical protein